MHHALYSQHRLTFRGSGQALTYRLSLVSMTCSNPFALNGKGNTGLMGAPAPQTRCCEPPGRLCQQAWLVHAQAWTLRHPPTLLSDTACPVTSKLGPIHVASGTRPVAAYAMAQADPNDQPESSKEATPASR